MPVCCIGDQAITCTHCAMLHLLVSLLAAASALRPRTVIVTGATGKTGQAVVKELLKDDQTTIRCFVRNETKAREVLPVDNPRVRFGPVDLEDPENVEQRTLDGDADAVVWCATGLASDGSTLIDQISLPTLAKALPKVSRDAPPNCVMSCAPTALWKNSSGGGAVVALLAESSPR